jgi:hypothetical protein
MSRQPPGTLLLVLMTLAGAALVAQQPTPAVAAPAAAAAAADSTVRPGMNAAQVRAAWGAPSGTRTRGDYTYIFYANDCQPACGIQDVVILERGQVVDAVARGRGHRYDGVSSSPVGRTPSPTPSTPNRSARP